MWRKPVERLSQLASGAAIATSLLQIWWYLGRRHSFQPLDQIASWSLLLACLCPILVYRSQVSRGFLLLSAASLVWLNGYISDALIAPLMKNLPIGYDRQFWSATELDFAVAVFFPLAVAAAKVLELESRHVRAVHGRRAVKIGVIWGTIVTLIFFQPWSGLVHYCLAIIGTVWLAAYLYHIAWTEYVLFQSGSEVQSPAYSHTDSPLALG